MTHASRMMPLILLMVWSPPAALAEEHAAVDGGVRLIAVAGGVHHQDRRLTRPASLPTTAQLKLDRGAAALILITAGTDPSGSLAVAMTGGSSVKILGSGAEVTLLRGNRIALSGAGTLLLRGWRIELKGSILVQDYVVYVTSGQAKIRGRDIMEHSDTLRDTAPSLLTKLLSGLGSSPRPRSPQRIKAGQSARLEIGGGITVAAGLPSLESHLIWSKALVPPPWTPDIGSVNPGAMNKAKKLTRQRLQAQRETASCGCTESSGSGGPAVGSGGTVTPVERTNAVVRVRITGMPRRIE